MKLFHFRRLHLQVLKIAAITLLGMVALYVLFDWTMSSLVHARKEVLVPDLRGKTLDEALSLLSSLNLGLRKEGEEFDQTLPSGSVMRQTPSPGIAVREGKIVRVTVSQGGRTVYIPDVIGQPARSAEIAIRSAGLSIGEETTRYSLVRKKDQVVAQDPPPGTAVEKDFMINLVISAGLPPDSVLLMPEWGGENIREASAWAEEHGLPVEVREETTAGAEPGTVLRQEPPADSELSPGQTVIFFVANAESTADRPNVFRYQVPASGGQRHIRLVLIDEGGEHELFDGVRPAGSVIELPLTAKGKARVRVFVNNILTEERDVQ